MSLLLTHPELPTCDDCEKWLYDEETWLPTLRPAVGGERVPRPKAVNGQINTPCWTCPKTPRGVEGSPQVGREQELSDQNWQAYIFNSECRAVGKYPDDAIVRKNAAIIQRTEESVARLTAQFGAVGFKK